jgi:hypothetical protein
MEKIIEKKSLLYYKDLVNIIISYLPERCDCCLNKIKKNFYVVYTKKKQLLCIKCFNHNFNYGYNYNTKESGRCIEKYFFKNCFRLDFDRLYNFNNNKNNKKILLKTLKKI